MRERERKFVKKAISEEISMGKGSKKKSQKISPPNNQKPDHPNPKLNEALAIEDRNEEMKGSTDSISLEV